MKKFNTNEVKFIQERACERIVEIFDALDFEYVERHDYLHCACPVHDGSNDRALFWAIRTSHWECKTRGCHKDPVTGPSSSIFGLVRGTMSRKTEKEWGFQQTVNFVAQILGLEQCQVDEKSTQDMEIAKIVKNHRKKQLATPSRGIPLATMIPYLSPDKIYYPNRGVSSEIISKYHISFCNNKGKPMYKRAFFPVLDVTGRYVVGWSGRSIYDKCSKCSMHHHSERASCPDSKCRGMYTKWKHSENFPGESVLYNIWYAKPFISKTGTVILVEGAGDVWALEAAGVRNSVAVLGTSLSKSQRLLLQNAGALTIVCVFDDDKAGQEGMKKLERDLIHYFRIFCITPETVNDIGEMLPKDIRDKVESFVLGTSKEKILQSNEGE